MEGEAVDLLEHVAADEVEEEEGEDVETEGEEAKMKMFSEVGEAPLGNEG